MFSDDQILDAALELVAASGPSAATIAAISGAIGVSAAWEDYHRRSESGATVAPVLVIQVGNAPEGKR
jgi:hypothetical protein